jgi:GNAT superfamily N-acetyltransferase
MRPIRAVTSATDWDAIVALINAVELEPITVDMLHERDQRTPGSERWRVAEDETARVVGISESAREPWMTADEAWLWVAVDPSAQGQGAGVALFDDALARTCARGATTLRSQVRDDRPDDLAIAERRGFRIDRHVFDATLELAAFDERPLADAIDAAQVAGFRFLIMAEAGASREMQRQVYDLNRRVSGGIPGAGAAFAPFEDFKGYVFGARWYRPEGQILAFHGARLIGFTDVGYFTHTNSAYNMMTGVDRAYRGRGIALALKLLAIRYARTTGAALIRTNNDSENAPVLALNRKLGYQPEPGHYHLVRISE